MRRKLSLRDVANELPNCAKRRKLLRVIGRAECELAEAHRRAESVASAWDSQQLRTGDCVQIVAGKPGHPNAWLHSSTVKQAFESLGATRTHHSRDTAHELSAVGCVAHAAMMAQEDVLTDFARSIKSGVAKLDWAIVQRCWDSTPRDIEFGRLTSLLCPVARYFAPGPDGAWEVCTHTEAKARGLKCKRGVLELFAQTCDLVWDEPPPSGEQAPPGSSATPTSFMFFVV